MYNNLEKWLLAQGGPAIQLRMSALQNSSNVKIDVDNAISTLLDNDEVHTLLNYFDGFQTQDRDKKTFEHLIHFYKDTCIENFFPLIMDMGFRFGIPIFEEKMEPVANIFKYLFSCANESVEYYNLTGMLHRFFFMSGYLFPEVIISLENRINAIYKVAMEREFDIYKNDNKLPKKPQIWAEIGVIKDEMNPFNPFVEKPLPTIYDIWAMAYYVESCTNQEIIGKINEIVSYILDPEFQKIREGYGLIWVKDRRIYHACGWSPTLPLYESDGRPIRPNHYSALDHIDLMSRFTKVQKSKWFYDCLNHLEQFKTKNETYLFPVEYQYRRIKYIDKAFLNKANMSLKRNEREFLKRELVSTMKMLEIYRRMM